LNDEVPDDLLVKSTVRPDQRVVRTEIRPDVKRHCSGQAIKGFTGVIAQSEERFSV
jgi:hypothetical protein